MGRRVPVEDDAGSECSEWELRERQEREEEREAETETEELGAAGGLGAGEELTTAFPTHALLHGIRRRGLGDGPRFPLFLSFVTDFRSVFSFPL